jgi:hypothetical protein
MFVLVMRNKIAEWRAIDQMLGRGRLQFIPLVEAVREPFIKTNKRVAKNLHSEMQRMGRRSAAVADQGHIWCDLGHLLGAFSPKDVALAHEYLLNGAGLTRERIVPVVRTSSPPEIVEAAIEWHRQAHTGVCIRVDGITQLETKTSRVAALVEMLALPPEDLDLVVDTQDLPSTETHDRLRAAFPLHSSARTWATLGGAFPKSISHLSPKEYEHRLARVEWSSWRDEVDRPGDFRRPLYGDYAAQPAVYSPSPPFPGSPSIRYTTEEDFIVLRGRGKADLSQYIGHSRFLRERPYYRSVAVTAGDEYVEQIATGMNSGSRSSWRTAQFRRHVEVVAAQVAARVPA